MAQTYRIYDQHGQYYVTITVEQWVDVFTRRDYIDIVLESLRHCQKKKGLKIYAWVLMTNHIHAIISSDGEPLSDIIRDFKKFTATQVVNAIASNPRESRKHWLLWLLKNEGSIAFWQDGYHAEEIYSREYLYSSCGDFYGIRKGLLKLAEP